MNIHSDRLLDILNRCDINGNIGVDAGTDKNNPHSYIEPYAHVLGKFSDREGTLLEIGVRWGGSMVLWHEFFPKFNFCFLDIENLLETKNLNKLNSKRYQYLIGDAYTTEMRDKVKSMFNSFDIIIDDGPHTLESQIKCIELYLPLLKSKGVLCIEDIQSNQNLDALKSVLLKIPNILFYLIDMRWKSSLPDDMILLIWKNDE